MDLYFCCWWSQDEGRILIYTPIWFLPQDTAADRFPPGGLDCVKAAFSHGKCILLEHFGLTLGMNTKGSDSCATVTSSINSTGALEGQEGLKAQPLPLGGDAEPGLPCLQLWPPQKAAWGSPGCLQADGAGCWHLHLPTQGLLPLGQPPLFWLSALL